VIRRSGPTPMKPLKSLHLSPPAALDESRTNANKRCRVIAFRPATCRPSDSHPSGRKIVCSARRLTLSDPKGACDIINDAQEQSWDVR
jgi:hypothetical protein